MADATITVGKGDIETIPFNPNAWAEMTPENKAAETIFEDAIKQTNAAIDWYTKAKRTKASLSRWLRGAAIFAGILGGLAPIFAAMAPAMPANSTAADLQLLITQAGYIAVGIAAGLIAFDRFFGLSSGWIRYMTAMTAIERLRLEFILDWARLRRQAGQQLDVLKMLDRAVAFRKALNQIVEDETSKWVSEFQAAMNDLDKYVRDTQDKAKVAVEEMKKQQAATLQEMEKERAAPKTGAINLTLAADWTGEVEISVEGKPFKKTIARAIGITNLLPPCATVEVRGTKNNAAAEASKAVPIKAGEFTDLTL
jgi:hypothetical protein